MVIHFFCDETLFINSTSKKLGILKLCDHDLYIQISIKCQNLVKLTFLSFFTEQAMINLDCFAFPRCLFSELLVLLPPHFFACASLELLYFKQVTGFVPRSMMVYKISVFGMPCEKDRYIILVKQSSTLLKQSNIRLYLANKFNLAMPLSTPIILQRINPLFNV